MKSAININLALSKKLQKPMKILKILSIIALISIISCKKPQDENNNLPNNPGKFNEIKTDPNFNWNTALPIELIITGLKTINPIKNTLTVSNKSKTANYYSGNHLMEENLNLKFGVPSALDSLLIKFGSIEKTYKVEKTINAEQKSTHNTQE